MSTTTTTDAGAQCDPHAVPSPVHPPEHGYAIGDPGRAAREIGPGLPPTPSGWPDTAIDAARVDGLELRAASVRGLSHRRTGTPRHDSYSVCWQPRPGRLVVTVCDGVGSLEFSHEAADLAAVRMPALLDCPAGSTAPAWPAAFATISAEVDALATAHGRAMATTVISACITANAGTGYRAEIAWLGDSAAYLLRDEAWKVVGGSPKAVDGDAPLVSSTAALPCIAPEPRCLTINIGTGDALFLMTDGVADPLGSGRGEVGATLAQWWSIPPDKGSSDPSVGRFLA